MKKKIIKPKWHKEWDRMFKHLLEKEMAVQGGWGFNLTMNDLAKQHIEKLLEERTRDLFHRHNLLVVAYEKICHLKNRKQEIKRMIEGNIKSAENIKKDLLRLLNSK